MIPKSRSRGSAEPIRTAKPPMVVAADVKNARPVRPAAVAGLRRGRESPLSFLDVARQDEDGELGTRRDDQWPADRRERAQA